jgi:hypothetical protein
VEQTHRCNPYGEFMFQVEETLQQAAPWMGRRQRVADLPVVRLSREREQNCTA